MGFYRAAGVSKSNQAEYAHMDFRQLGGSGLKVPVLCLGTATFGGSDEFFKAFGTLGVKEATRLVDIALDAGLTIFDTADTYSHGQSQQILGEAIKGRRDKVLISTKSTFRTGSGPNDVGSSRFHLTEALHASLRALGTDYVDLFQLHGFDALTPVEEALRTLDDFVRQGKIRYIGCSNFSGWHLQKSLNISEKYGLARHVAHQAYYSLVGRDYEWELMPLAIDQRIGTVVWSPLGWERLTGLIRRGQPLPENSRLRTKSAKDLGPQIPEELLFRVIDAIDEIAQETGKTVPQIALNWLLQRPTVSTIIIGARTEDQLQQNLGAVGWNLTPAQVSKLDEASRVPLPYPYWHQAQFAERNPPVARITGTAE
jgi:aryl-alcohol dehydrogenase-like predicted oxidoreductase